MAVKTTPITKEGASITAIKPADKVYLTLCTLFTVIVLIGNLTYRKFVHLPLFSLFHFELSVGVILYPFTFLITDLIAEFFGRKKAQFCIVLSIIINLLAALIITGMDYLEATEWSILTDDTFHFVFSTYSVALLASLLACFISQRVDVAIYLFIKKLTRARWLWLRNYLSTAISLLVDTTIVIFIMNYFGILPEDKALSILKNNYVFKLMIALCFIPLFYFGYYILQRLLRR